MEKSIENEQIAIVLNNSMMMQGIPKHDLLSEQAVLGTLLFDKDIIPYILGDIREQYFYDDNHRIIFKAIKGLVEKGSDVDLLILKNALEAQDITIKLGSKEIVDKFKKENLLDEIGGISYLTELTESVGHTSNIKDYCRIMKENYVLREYQKLSGYILNGLNNNLDTNGIAEIIEKQIKVINSLGVDDKTEDMLTIMTEHYASLAESLQGNDTDIKRIKTGFKDLDKVVGSYHGGDLIVVAASSSIGKTMFALNTLDRATKRKERGLLFTMEMNKNKISDILITMNSDIKYQTLQTWNDEIVEMRSKLLLAKDRVKDGTDPDDSHVKTIEAKINQLVEAKEKILEDNEMVIDELAGRQLFIDDRAGVTTQTIRNKIMELSIKDPLDIVVVDQLSLMSGEGKGIRERYDIITGQLKQIAREYNIPIILVVQLLGKELGKRPGHVPRNDDIKESFKIYEDADKVLLLNRPMFWAQEDGATIDEFTDKSMHVYITKNRGGNTTDIMLGCDITQQKLYDATELEKSLRQFTVYGN